MCHQRTPSAWADLIRRVVLSHWTAWMALPDGSAPGPSAMTSLASTGRFGAGAGVVSCAARRADGVADDPADSAALGQCHRITSGTAGSARFRGRSGRRAPRRGREPRARVRPPPRHAGVGCPDWKDFPSRAGLPRMSCTVAGSGGRARRRPSRGAEADFISQSATVRPRSIIQRIKCGLCPLSRFFFPLVPRISGFFCALVLCVCLLLP